MAQEQSTTEIVDKLGDMLLPEEADDTTQTPPETEATDQDTEEEAEEPAETEEAEAEKPAEPELVEVEFEGKVYETPPELKDALLRQSDYTQKTQSLADQRREIEHRQTQIQVTEDSYKFAQSIQEELSQAAQLDVQLNYYKGLDYTSMTTEEMFQNRNQMDMVKDQRDTLLKVLETKQNEFQQTQQQANTALLKEGAEILAKSIPNWNQETQKDISDFAVSYGYSREEVESLTDPRAVQLLHKAMQFDKLKEGIPATQVKLAGVQTIKPSARDNKMSEATKQKLKIHKIMKNPKLSDKQRARAAEGPIGERFG